MNTDRKQIWPPMLIIADDEELRKFYLWLSFKVFICVFWGKELAGSWIIHAYPLDGIVNNTQYKTTAGGSIPLWRWILMSARKHSGTRMLFNCAEITHSPHRCQLMNGFAGYDKHPSDWKTCLTTPRLNNKCLKVLKFVWLGRECAVVWLVVLGFNLFFNLLTLHRSNIVWSQAWCAAIVPGFIHSFFNFFSWSYSVAFGLWQKRKATAWSRP